MEPLAVDIKELPENIRYEIARQNIEMYVNDVKNTCGLSDLLVTCALESVLGQSKANFNTSTAFQAVQIYGKGQQAVQ